MTMSKSVLLKCIPRSVYCIAVNDPDDPDTMVIYVPLSPAKVGVAKCSLTSGKPCAKPRYMFASDKALMTHIQLVHAGWKLLRDDTGTIHCVNGTEIASIQWCVDNNKIECVGAVAFLTRVPEPPHQGSTVRALKGGWKGDLNIQNIPRKGGVNND